MYEMSIVKNLTIATNKEVKPREFKKFDLTVKNIEFGPENHLSWVATVCTSPWQKVNKIPLHFDTTLKISYFYHSELIERTDYYYVDCTPNQTKQIT